MEDRVTMSASAWSHLDTAQAAALLSGTTYVQNELVVALDTTSPTFADLLATESAKNSALVGSVTDVEQLSEASADNPALYQLTLSADADFAGTLAAISNWTTVEWVQPNFVAATDGMSAAEAGGSQANSAPVLTSLPNLELAAILEDDVNNQGMLISALLATGAGGDPISDADAGALEGIAVTAVTWDLRGKWQYSLNNGTTWSDIGFVWTPGARLLAADAQTRIRFVPSADTNGPYNGALRFKAWDQTTGINGGFADVTAPGGSSAFSTADAQTNVNVTPVNDVPTFTIRPHDFTDPIFGARTQPDWPMNATPGALESSQTVTYTLTNDNNNLFAVQPAIDSAGVLRYTPKAGVYGTAIVSVWAQDDGGTANGGVDTTGVQTFRIDVIAFPQLSLVGDRSILEDGSLTVDFTVSDLDTPLSAVTLSTTTTDAALTPDAGRVLTDLGGGNYRLTISPATNTSGTATIGIRAFDGTVTAGSQFPLTVTAVNDAPSFVKGADQTVGGNGVQRSVSNWASNISQGPNETGQTLAFQVTNDNSGLFAVQPAISSSGTLTYTPAAGARGTATVNVQLKDTGGTSNGGVDGSEVQTFTINVAAVPQVSTIADQTILEDGFTTAISFSVSDADTPLTSISVGTSSSNATLAPSSGRVLTDLGGGNYRLVIKPAANRFGTATITVNASDGTSTGSRTFLLTVNPVNDVPSFTAGGNYGGRADGTPVSTPWATNISAGSNDTGQNVTFLVAADNPSLFSVQPAISSSGTLTYTFQTGANGSSTVRVRLKDDGGTADGGIDTSAEQTFVIRATEPPTITSVSNRTINEDGYARILFTIADSDDPLSALVLTQSWTGTIVPSTSRILTDLSGGTYELIAVPTADSSGTATITLTVTDGYATATTSFTLTVNAVNDAPSFVKGADQFGATGLQTVNGWATMVSAGPNETSQTVSFVVTNDNPTAFAVQPSISSTGVLTFQRVNFPPPGLQPYAVVTVRLTDNGGTADGGIDTSAVQTFVISWAQSFTFVPPSTLRTVEDTPAFWDLTVTDYDTPDELLTAVVSAKNDAIFAPGSLTFTHLAGDIWRLTGVPAPNASGTATIYVDMTDDHGLTSHNQLSIIVGTVNDVPTFTAGANLAFSPGTDARTVAGWATGISAGPLESSQTLTFVVSNDNPGLFSVAPAINAAGDLTFTQAAGATGTAVVSVYLGDSGGTAAGGIDTSPTRTFTITLSAPPSIGPISDVTLDEDGSTTVDVFVDDPDTAPADLVLSADSADGLLLPPDRATFDYVAGNHWRMTLAPAADRFGTSTVTVTAAQGSSAASTTFLLTVAPQNDPPIFAIPQTSLSVLTDADVVRAGWVTGVAVGPNESGQNTAWLVTVDDPSLFAAPPTIDAAGTLQFRGAGLDGTARVTLQLRDDAAGADTSPPQTFEVRFTDVVLSPGILDPTFDGDGRQTLVSPLGVNDFARDTAVQADGKTIVVGCLAMAVPPGAARGFVMRLNVDGTPDTTFGAGGMVTIYNPGTSTSFQMHAVELTADGKIVVAGDSGNGIYVARFNADGTWDETFGTAGATLLDGFTSLAPTVGLAIQSDGKIVVARNGGTTTSIVVARLTANGLLDTTFGTGGKAVVSQTVTIVADDVAVQSDGKIVVAGTRGTGSSSDFTALRFLANGTADFSFGTNGIVVVDLGAGTASDTAYRVALQNDGKIVMAGTSGGRFAIVRLTVAGALDTTFDADGKRVEVSPYGYTAAALALTSDGRIVVAGSGGFGATSFALARYTSAGTLDSSFGTNGFVNTDLGPDSETINAIAVAPDGRITAVGRSSTTNSDVAVAKYYYDGTLNSTFGASGVARFNLDHAATLPTSTLVLPDGRIIVGGISSNRLLVWRLNPDGSLDLSFGTGGYYLAAGTGGSTPKIYRQADGKLLILDATSNTLTRLTSDGVLDTSFDADGVVSYSSLLFTSETDLAFDAGGSIYLAGSKTNSVTGFDEFALARFTSGGVLDASFDDDGQALIDVGTSHDRAAGIVFDAAGKILLAGTARIGTTDDLAVVRLDPDGTVDDTFSDDGRTIVALSPASDAYRDMLVRPDGRIVIAGYGSAMLSVVRLTSEGELDSTFDADGIVATGVTSAPDAEIFLQPNGKLLIGGSLGSPSLTQLFAMRLLEDGSRDFSLDGADGLATFPISTLGGLTDMSAAMQADGKLLLVGQATMPDDQNLVVLRVLTANDLPVGATPSIGTIPSQSILEDGSLTFQFTTADADTPPDFLAFSVASANTAVVNASSFAFSHLGGGVWQATVTPRPDGFGTATVTLTISDGMTSSSRSFNITVDPLNDPPRFVIGPEVVAYPGFTTSISNFATGISPGGSGETGQAFQFLVTAADSSLFSIQPTILFDGTLTFAGQASAFGKSTTVTVRLQDTGGTLFGGVDTSAPQTFTITFDKFPSIEPIADRTIAEGTSLAPVAVIVSDADSPISLLVVSAVSGDPSILNSVNVANLGAGVWSLTATPAADALGSVVVTVNATDGLRTTARSFTLNITPVNDAPSFVKGEDQSVAGSSLVSVPHWAKAVSAGPSETLQNLSFQIDVDDPSLFSVLPTISADGTLSYAAAPGKTGTANVTVRLHDDGGTTGGGVDTSPAQTFAVHVLGAVPAGPTFDPTFDGDGIAIGVSPLGGVRYATETALQADGKILVIDGRFIRRFLADGTLDAAFGSAGSVDLNFHDQAGTPRDLVAAGGKIYVTFTGHGAQVARLNDDGTPDVAFGVGGLATPTSSMLAVTQAIAVQSDGEIVVVGSGVASSSPSAPAIVRFNADGRVDTLFGVGGVMELTGIDGRFMDILVRTDGRIIASGYGRAAGSTGTNDIVVAQVTADGRLDTSFSADGVALFGSIPSAADSSEALTRDAAGRILVLGSFGSATGIVRLLADGTLDRSFGTDGIATFSFNSATNKEIVVSADGRITAVGSMFDGGQRAFLAVRLQIDGSLDPSFDGDGVSTISVGPGYDQAYAAALQPDGKLLLVGSAQLGTGLETQLAMARVLTDGSLDPSFGIGGRVTVASGPSTLQYRSVVRQPDGKYLAAGTIYQPTETANVLTFVVARYQADGALDTSFGTGGYAIVAPSTFTDARIALQSDGKIVLASAGGLNSSLVRLNADGSLDTSFGGDGSIDASFSPYALLIQADGKIVVAGQRASGFAVARYNLDGTLDTSMGGIGDVVFDNPSISSERVSALSQQADGKLVLVGQGSSDRNFIVARINLDGTLDTSFSTDGWQTTAVATYKAAALSAAVGPDGRITIGGTINTGSLNESDDWALVRYNSDGSLDTSFDGDGIVNYAPGDRNDTFGELRLQSDGKIVAVGSAANAFDTDTIVVRFNVDGTLDQSFFNDGVLLTSLSPGVDAAQGLTIDPDGKIVVVGYAEVNGRYEGRILRLLPDALDVPPPAVTGLYVRGSSWSAAYLDYLDATGHGDAALTRLGFSLASGPSQTTLTAAWSNLNRITVGFDADVTVASADALSLTNSAGQTIVATNFQYLNARTVEFTLPTLSTSKYLVHLDAAKVAGTATGLALDGEWTTSSTTWAQCSGDGTAGGSFNFRFNVLSGDFDSSGSVAFGEIGLARLQLGKTTAAPDFNYRQDFDGSGSITFGEIGQARLLLGTGLAGLAEPPTPPEAQDAFALERQPAVEYAAFAEVAPPDPVDQAETVDSTAITTAPPSPGNPLPADSTMPDPREALGSPVISETDAGFLISPAEIAVNESAVPQADVPETPDAASLPTGGSLVVAAVFINPAEEIPSPALLAGSSTAFLSLPALPSAAATVRIRPDAGKPPLVPFAPVRFDRLAGEEAAAELRAGPAPLTAWTRNGDPVPPALQADQIPFGMRLSAVQGTSPHVPSRPWRRLENRQVSPSKINFSFPDDGFLDVPFPAD